MVLSVGLFVTGVILWFAFGQGPNRPGAGVAAAATSPRVAVA